VLVVLILFADVAGFDYSAVGATGIARGYVCNHAGAGFTLNTLSLFGLVLAIGIVCVTTRLWWWENVERNLELGFAAAGSDAAGDGGGERADYRDCTGAVRGCSCRQRSSWDFRDNFTNSSRDDCDFDGDFGVQLAELEPGAGGPAFAVARREEKIGFRGCWTLHFGWFFRGFNRFFAWASGKYGTFVGHAIRSTGIALVIYAGLIALTVSASARCPADSCRRKTSSTWCAFAQLPNGATLDSHRSC